MIGKTQSIEVDEVTATALRRHAAQRGVSVSDVVAELVPLAIDDATVAELDRRWAAVEAGGVTVSNERVVRWLETWGAPGFKAWRDR